MKWFCWFCNHWTFQCSQQASAACTPAPVLGLNRMLEAIKKQKCVMCQSLLLCCSDCLNQRGPSPETCAVLSSGSQAGILHSQDFIIWALWSEKTHGNTGQQLLYHWIKDGGLCTVEPLSYVDMWPLCIKSQRGQIQHDFQRFILIVICRVRGKVALSFLLTAKQIFKKLKNWHDE